MTVSTRSIWERIGPPLLLVGATLAAYANALRAPFVFLDQTSIVDNSSIRHLWPLGPVLSPPVAQGLTVGGRPLVNLSLAINYALGGLNPSGYHAMNVGIHVLAVLVLFGVVRRTLSGGIWPAFAVALLWAVHPLQTESVTYVIQRAESLMGLFYLLTLYCFIRRWSVLTVFCCLCGMATKEVMVSAPVIVLLYDRTFISGTFAVAWQRRRGLYLALAATWIPLACFVAGTGGNRGGTSGFGLGVSWGTHVLTQFPAVMHYLRLAIWPHPLVFYYAVRWLTALEAAPYALPVLALAATGAWLWLGPVRWRWLGFLIVWFFAILGPTSLVPGMSQTMAEHRMYLALAPVMAALVVGGWLGFRASAAGRWTLACAVAAAALGLGALTVRRNRVYASELRLWSDTVAKVANNPYTQNNLGIAMAAAGRPADAIAPFDRALELKPDYAEAHDNLGLALVQTGRFYEAIGHYERAVAINPRNAASRNNLAVVLAGTGQLDAAIAQYEAGLKLAPDQAETHYNLANALAHRRRNPEAIAHYERALQLRPAYAEAAANLGAAYANAGRLTEAVATYERALALTPKDADVHYNLGLAWRALGRTEAAQAQFEIAARLQAAH